MGRSPPAPRHLVGLGAVVIANLVPLVGVSVRHWDLSTLLVLYWLEAIGTASIAALKALFAERASVDASARAQPLGELREKRGGWRVREGWPPIYVRNLPFVTGILGISIAFLVAYGALIAAQLSIRPANALSAGVLVGAGCFFAARLVEFRLEYLGRIEYADVSARMIAATPARHSILLLVLGPLAVGAESGTGGIVLLVAVVGAKLAADLYGLAADHLPLSPDSVAGRLLGPRDASEPPRAVEVPDAPVDARVRTDARAVLLGGTAAIALGLASGPGYVALLLLVLAGIAFGPVAVAAATIPIALVCTAKLGTHYLLYGPIEYRRRGDRVVAYDAILEEPQWATTVARGDVSTANRVSDRLLGTGTLSLSGVDSGGRSSVRIGPVADLEDAVDALELPASDASPPGANRTMVAVGLALAVCFLLLPVGLYAAPDASTGSAIAVTVFLGPFLLYTAALLLLAGLSRI